MTLRSSQRNVSGMVWNYGRGGRLARSEAVPRPRFATVAVLAAAVSFCAMAFPCVGHAEEAGAVAAEDTPARPRLGKSIRLVLPITATIVDRVESFIDRATAKAEETGAELTLIFQFEVPPDQEEYARGTQFSDALKLARLISGNRLNGVRTVAYVPQSLPGHALLVAMACDDIMMPPEATLGPVGEAADTIRNTERSAYKEIADNRRTIPAEVALWLLEPSREVLKVETEAGREYVSPEGLERLSQKHTVVSSDSLTELIEGPAGQFTGDEARRFDSVKYMPASRLDVAKELGLPPDAMDEDPSMVDPWRPVLVALKGPISTESVRQAQRLIEDKIKSDDANFVCVWIDSPGGAPAASISLAAFLDTLDPNEIRTVAYVPSEARSDAALIALACYDVVMGPQAELGGSGAYAFSEEEIRALRETIRDATGPWRARSWSVVAAMIDPRLEVFRCTRPGEQEYFCDEQLGELAREHAKLPRWEKHEQITTANAPLLVDGTRAVELGLVNRTAESFTEFKEHYGLQGSVELLEPGWADFLITAMASPGVAALLLTIAFVAMYAELHAPGIGVGGFVATLCFLLFFWSHYLGGTAGWLEIILFLAGIGCLLMEVFVLPGFGIFGLGGGCLVLASLILASQTFVLPRNAYQIAQLQRSLLTVAAAGVGIAAAAALLRRWLPHTPLFNQMFLQPPTGEEAERVSQSETLVDFDGFVGQRGVASTQLTPSGKGRLGDALVDVMTDGDVIQRGAEIEVVEVHGNHVIVKAVT